MTPEDRVVCLCTRQDFDANHIEAVQEIAQKKAIDWRVVYKTAVRHHVSPLVGVNLSTAFDAGVAVPDPILDYFQQSRIRNVFIKKISSPKLEKIGAYFSQMDIDVMLVKGEAMNRVVYDQPWSTVSSDVDIIIGVRKEDVRPEAFEGMVQFLESFNQDRAPYEQHIEFEFYEHHDISMNDMLKINWALMWREAEPLKIGEQTVLVMNRENLLLAAAVNSARKRYFWLKSLLDIQTLVSRSPDLDWDQVIENARDFKCNTILFSALIVTQSLLDCPMPDGVLNELKINPARERLIRSTIKRLSQRLTLAETVVVPSNKPSEREINWGLLLTYASFRSDQLGPKLRELFTRDRAPLGHQRLEDID